MVQHVTSDNHHGAVGIWRQRICCQCDSKENTKRFFQVFFFRTSIISLVFNDWVYPLHTIGL